MFSASNIVFFNFSIRILLAAFYLAFQIRCIQCVITECNNFANATNISKHGLLISVTNEAELF